MHNFFSYFLKGCDRTLIILESNFNALLEHKLETNSLLPSTSVNLCALQPHTFSGDVSTNCLITPKDELAHPPRGTVCMEEARLSHLIYTRSWLYHINIINLLETGF